MLQVQRVQAQSRMIELFIANLVRALMVVAIAVIVVIATITTILLSLVLAVNRQQVLRLHLRQLRHRQHHLPITLQHQHLLNKQIAQAY